MYLVRPFILVSAVLTLFLSSAHSQELRVYPDEYVVEFKESNSLAAMTSGEQGSEKLEQAGVKLDRDLGQKQALLRKQRPGKTLAVVSSESVPYDSNDTTCSDLVKQGIAKYCSPNYEMKINVTPNDPQFPTLWGLSASAGINAPEAWDVSRGSTDVVVAVIDTGVDYNHPDLVANVWNNPNETVNGKDDDGNGYVDDMHGMNAFSGSGNCMDDNGHGTHVSGTIGALGNNSRGVVGVNWNVKIMGLKFLNANGGGSLAGAVQAINYMVTMKNRGVNIKVSNNSWGGGGFSQALHDAIARARDAGIIFVAAAGNEANDNDASPAYPASYELSNVVSVAAIDQNQNLASFSNYGVTQVDIAAPGVSILSTTPNNSYSSFSGTSMATPHVAGALSLLLANEPALNADQAIARLYESAVDAPTLDGMVRTARKLNAARMVLNQTSPLRPVEPTPEPCAYSVEEIAYSPDYSADSQAIISQADELSFHTLDLPFAFPFHRRDVFSVSLSPNGVIYTSRAPQSMDYQNTKSAPLNSIAALHSDLVASQDPQGIRVYASTDKVVIYWRTKHYSDRNGGDVEVRTILYPDGKIEEFLAFSDAQVQKRVQGRATIGLTGPTTASAVTYARNSSLITNGLALRYSPLCSGGNGAVTITDIKVKVGVNESVKNNSSNDIERLRVLLSGFGTGNANVQVAINGQWCPNTSSVSVQNGKALMRAKLPKNSNRIRTVSFRSGRVQATKRLKQSATRGKNKSRSIRQERLIEMCDRVLNSVR